MVGLALGLAWWLRPAGTPSRPPSLPTPAVAPPAPPVPAPVETPILAPGLTKPAVLGEGEPLRVALPGGGEATATFWVAQRRDAPLILAMAGSGEPAVGWLPLLRTLKGEREVALAIVDSAPQVPGQSAIALRASAQTRMAAVAALLLSRTGFADAPVALLGAREAGAGALLLAAQDERVRAVAALSPPVEAADSALDEAIEALARRQVFLAWSVADPNAAAGQTLARTLQNRRLASAEGAALGLQLLEQGQTRSDLAGWLFAALGRR